MPDKIDICDWFDITNLDHLKAFQIMENSGRWPKDFIPEHVTFRPDWHRFLLFRMAERYLEIMLRSVA